MTRSRRGACALRSVLAGLIVTPALACTLLAGLDKNFETVACLHDCDVDSSSTPDGMVDGSMDAPEGDASVDAAEASSDPCNFVDVTDPSVTTNPDYAGWPVPNVQGTNKGANVLLGTSVVHDLVTGLNWQREVAPTPMDVAQGATYCASISSDGGPPWRMPTRIELGSLQRYRGNFSPPCVADEFVPGDPASYVLSSTPAANTGGADHYGFNFNTCGAVIVTGASTAQSIRCVQGAAAVARFQLSEKCNIVRDVNAGLEWDRELHTAAYRVTSDAGDFVDVANNTCAELSKQKGPGWTLPTSPELYSHMDATRLDPSVSLVLFPGTPANGKLLSSSLRSADVVAAIQISEGTETGTFFAEEALVRCVRHIAK